MITARDAGFHPVPPGQPEWAEVFGVGFHLPEPSISVRVYLLFRPQFGVVQTSVTVTSRDALLPWHADCADVRPHVPAPQSLTEFTLAYGVSLQTIDPHQRWRLRYDSGDGTRFDVRFDATMAPYSAFDAALNPRARPAPDGVGNFEQSGRVTGTLQLRGRDHAIDCRTLKNHGCGPRRDRNHHGPTGASGATWLHAHHPMARGCTASGCSTCGSRNGGAVHGYALQDGRVSGLANVSARIERDADLDPTAIAIDAIDAAGNAHRTTSRAATSAPELLAEHDDLLCPARLVGRRRPPGPRRDPPVHRDRRADRPTGARMSPQAWPRAHVPLGGPCATRRVHP